MREVAIVGFAEKSRQTVWPDGVEVWTLNCAWRFDFARIDRLLEIHTLDQLTADRDNPQGWEADHWRWLQGVTFPVYMQERIPEVPASVKYPLDEIIEDLFCHLWREEVYHGDTESTEKKKELIREKYLTSSVGLLMALAIYERVNRIYLSGIELETGSEYTYQRDGMTYLIGLANGRGIDVILSEKSGLMRAKLYGFLS